MTKFASASLTARAAGCRSGELSRSIATPNTLQLDPADETQATAEKYSEKLGFGSNNIVQPRLMLEMATQPLPRSEGLPPK